jgi:hypothetical protein
MEIIKNSLLFEYVNTLNRCMNYSRNQINNPSYIYYTYLPSKIPKSVLKELREKQRIMTISCFLYVSIITPYLLIELYFMFIKLIFINLFKIEIMRNAQTKSIKKYNDLLAPGVYYGTWKNRTVSLEQDNKTIKIHVFKSASKKTDVEIVVLQNGYVKIYQR